MPHQAQTIVNLLPFRHVITTPIEILLGNLSGPLLMHTLSLQAAWAVGTGLIMIIMWRQGLKQYAPPGQ